LKFLLDTNALSEALKTRPDPGFLAWLDSVGSVDDEIDDRLHVSVLTIGEMRRGALKLDHGRRRDVLEAAIEGIVADYRDRLLAVDLDVAERWAVLADEYRKQGVSVGLTDELIAATALVHGQVLVTRNVRHFEQSGCRILSPWSG
jgi:predicted nucleic acid-binding protein